MGVKIIFGGVSMMIYALWVATLTVIKNLLASLVSIGPIREIDCNFKMATGGC